GGARSRISSIEDRRAIVAACVEARDRPARFVEHLRMLVRGEAIARRDVAGPDFERAEGRLGNRPQARVWIARIAVEPVERGLPLAERLVDAALCEGVVLLDAALQSRAIDCRALGEAIERIRANEIAALHVRAQVS